MCVCVFGCLVYTVLQLGHVRAAEMGSSGHQKEVEILQLSLAETKRQLQQMQELLATRERDHTVRTLTHSLTHMHVHCTHHPPTVVTGTPSPTEELYPKTSTANVDGPEMSGEGRINRGGDHFMRSREWLRSV